MAVDSLVVTRGRAAVALTFLVVTLALLAPAGADAGEGLLSPRLGQLQARLQQPDVEAATRSGIVESFWRERRDAGVPMVETIPDDAARVLVTFLWRGDASTRSVHVIVFDQGQFDSGAWLDRAKMAPFPGTDIWYRTYRMPCDLLFSYRFSVNDPGAIGRDTPDAERTRRNAALRPDPLNPKGYASRSGPASVALLPCAMPEPDMERHEGVPRGTVTEETFKGASGESHALQIYVPPMPDSRRGALPLVVTIGGQFADNYPLPAILDNLIATKKIRPAMVVSIGFTGMPEYVAASRSNEPFARYVATELVPWIRARYPAVSRRARELVIAGASAPGAGSMFVAMRHPEVFGNVISLGGGFAYPVGPAPDELIPSDHPVTQPIARELANRPRLPFRIYLGVGTLDDVPSEGREPRYGTSTVLAATRHLRDVLEARGYCLTYREFGGGHEALVWRRQMAEALTVVLATRPPCPD